MPKQERVSQIPDVYPHGLPLYWRDKQSGALPAAVKAFLDNQTVGGEISAEQITLVREYIDHYVNAPCWTAWESGPFHELNLLRDRVDGLLTPDAIHQWLMDALEIGMDPL